MTPTASCRWRRCRSTSRASSRARRPATPARDGRGNRHRARPPAGRARFRRPTTSTSAGSASSRRCARYPGALFVSAGGYHHHVGLNTWAGEGAPPPAAGRARARARSRSCCRTTLRSRRRGPPLAAAGVEAAPEDGRLRRRRPVRQPGRARRTAERVSAAAARACRSYWFAGVPGAEVAERHPERPVLHLPDVAELVRDEVVRDVVRSAAG